MTDPAEPAQMAEVSPHGDRDPLLGATIDGRYEVESVLGEGGMGLVYRGRHVVLNKPVAIKVLRPDVSKNEEIITRFRQEAQSASAIGNEHIIDISDFSTLPDGSTYFIMEYLDGTDLSGAIEAGAPFPPGRAIKVGRQIARALHAAHEAGIVHRDLKPDNVFLVNRGGRQDFVKVLDFGIAKVSNNASKLTRAGQVFGTPHYMSPEQCAGKAVDRRTDIYALGVILYECLTGEVPFDAENLMGVLTKHLYEEPTPPREKVPGLAPEFEALILRCMQKSADGRYQTMDEVLAGLDAVDAGLPASERADPTVQAVRQVTTADLGLTDSERRRPWLAVGGLLAVLGLGAAVAAVVLANSGEPAPEPAPAVAATPEPEPAPAAEPAALPAGQEESTDESGSVESTAVILKSDPAGAEVWKGSDLIGNTPLELDRPENDEKLELELRLRNYLTQPIRISSLTMEQVTVTMEKEERRRREHRTRSHRPRPTPTEEKSPPVRRPTPKPPQELRNPWEEG